jgi:hypothetical protein
VKLTRGPVMGISKSTPPQHEQVFPEQEQGTKTVRSLGCVHTKFACASELEKAENKEDCQHKILFCPRVLNEDAL